ncbi:fungal-specific transcription factor domain-containing protein [Achaetomium macrosporum]|uniref:Fungal-specific transcription factor domain-containing protein n=1 Tax=Achaetomium macrosporum TaxID=79813 RepID=A0AAN7C605_9PEZI|nr:fungal-specific transcription factor domain-containing protein [Achaetomium macrosporum]
MPPERRSERVEQRRRRKIPLACEPCRERKSRCDGGKPICSTCQRRSLPLHYCVYTLENARTASNEEYIKILHDRIRRLEQACAEHGIPTPPLQSTADGDASPAPAESPASPLSSAPLRSGSSLPIPNSAQSLRDHAASPAIRRRLPEASPRHERLEETESAASVTAMGTVSTEHDVCRAFDMANEFYGSSSAASFMKEACTSVKPHRHTNTHLTGAPSFSVNLAGSDMFGSIQFAQADKFALPPRALADRLLNRFWERVYWLHPFFHKPTFLRAYESLWRPAHEQPTEPSLPGLGLGSAPGADVGTIVFHCALNTIFALGAQFSDLSPKHRAEATETFFHRAKAFVGLDFTDMHNVGVVQAFLLMAILLHSTPFPSRCWNAVGLACRLAQGLGLHTESGRTSRPPLETEIRRRTWHGCVILDMIVSMMYGRPTMTAHLPDLPLPATLEFDDDQETSQRQAADRNQPSKMCFYAEYIRLCRILGEILSNVYQPSAGGAINGPSSSWDEHKSHGMDAILELDAKLLRYETALPPTMSWKSPCDMNGIDEERKLVVITQRTVLRGSFLYLRLMLHRPILTQLCARADSALGTAPGSPTESSGLSAGQELFTSFAAGCAKICLGAAADLIELVHGTYLTNTTGGWWWDGLYAFTAGLAIIVGYLCPTLLASLDRQRLERCWMMCQGILSHFASFSISAQRSLRLLQKVHADVMSRSSGTDKEGEPLTRPPSRAPAATHGECLDLGQEATVMPAEDMPLLHGSMFQWQVPAAMGADMLGAGLMFSWDQSLDLIAGELGMDIYQ